jgi:hypothetical protein
MLVKLKNMFNFRLNIFGAGDPPAETPGEQIPIDPPADPAAGDPPADPKGKDPFASFPDEKSFMARVTREGKKQMSTLLQGLGLKDETALKAMLDDKALKDQEGKTDLEKAIQRQQELITERDSAINKNNSYLKNAEIKTAAGAAGVKPERVNYLMKLMDLDQLELIDGKLDPITLNNQIKQIVTDIPELLGNAKADLPGNGGSSFQGGSQEPLSYDLIRKMSPEEVVKKMPAIQEFMVAHPLK